MLKQSFCRAGIHGARVGVNARRPLVVIQASLAGNDRCIPVAVRKAQELEVWESLVVAGRSVAGWYFQGSDLKFRVYGSGRMIKALELATPLSPIPCPAFGAGNEAGNAPPGLVRREECRRLVLAKEPLSGSEDLRLNLI